MSNPESSKPTDPAVPAYQASPPPDRFVAWAARLELSMLHRLLIVGAMGVLIMFGLFLANYSIKRADWYWSAMFPVFGLFCLGHQLIVGDTASPVWTVIFKQALHWLGPIVAVRIIFLQLARGQMDADAVALMILLILAVTCFLAGIHFDHSFIWVSAFLVAVGLLGTEIESYLWLIVIICLLAIALVVFTALLIRHRTSAPVAST
jgi:hypothetical protein